MTKPTSSKLGRATKHLNTLSRAKGLTPNGKKWLIQSLDPFHDTTIDPVGYPDVFGGDTVNVTLNHQLNVSAPAGVVGNWDAHIFTLPEASFQGFYLGQIVQNALNANNFSADGTSIVNTTVNLGMVNAWTGPSGTPWWIMNTIQTAALAPNVVAVCDSPTQYVNFNTRVTGFAIEVMNTTAEMYKQGEVTVYRMPQVQTTTLVFPQKQQTGANGLVTNPELCVASRAPPWNLISVEAMPDTASWPASEGAYLVPTLTSVNNPMTENVSQARMYSDGGVNNGASVFVAFSGTQTFANAGNTQLLSYEYSASKPINYDTSGAYFAGLSNSTTLVVQIKYFLEIAPTWNDTNIIAFAKPAAQYDPVALQIYATVLGKMPPGVPRGENPLGEWFSKVVDWMANNGTIAGHLAGTLIPEAALAGKVASLVAKVISQNYQSHKLPSVQAPAASKNKKKK